MEKYLISVKLYLFIINFIIYFLKYDKINYYFYFL